MEYQLHEDGYRVLTASNASSALQQFGSESIDLVLSDIRMPETDGLELLGKLMACARQLDMLMDDESIMRRWVERFLAGDYPAFA